MPDEPLTWRGAAVLLILVAAAAYAVTYCPVPM